MKGSATGRDLTNPDNFPPELAWVPAHYRLHPDDPVYLLLAWHWHRTQLSEDTMRTAVLELRALLDARVADLKQAAEVVSGINDGLAGVQAALEEKPAELSGKLEQVVVHPLERALDRAQALERALEPVVQRLERGRRRELSAALTTGVALGVLASVVLLLA